MNAQECGQLTLFPADSPVSPSPLPGSAEAVMMTVTSGRKCAGLLKNCGPVGSLVKMLLESSIWRSTRCFLTWKVSATSARRLLFRLVPSMPRTGGTGYALWQTPTVPNGGRVNPPDMSPTGKMPDGRKRQVGLEHQVKMVYQGPWPTPTARDYKGANSMEHLTREGMRNHTEQLANAVKLFPTPRVGGSRGKSGSGKRHGDLAAVVEGQLNPDWVEWLMGFPIGWTNL